MKSPDDLLVALEVTPAASFLALPAHYAAVAADRIKYQARAVFELRVKKHGQEAALDALEARIKEAPKILTGIDAPGIKRERPGLIIAYADIADIERAKQEDDVRAFDERGCQLLDPDRIVVAVLIRPSSAFIGLEIEEAAEVARALESAGNFVQGLQKAKIRLPRPGGPKA